MIFKVSFMCPGDEHARIAWIHGTNNDHSARRKFFELHPDADVVVAKSFNGEVIDATDYYVIVVNCLTGERYSLDRAYNLNKQPGYGIDISKCVESQHQWSNLDTPEGWDSDASIAYWMY